MCWMHTSSGWIVRATNRPTFDLVFVLSGVVVVMCLGVNSTIRCDWLPSVRKVDKGHVIAKRVFLYFMGVDVVVPLLGRIIIVSLKILVCRLRGSGGDLHSSDFTQANAVDNPCILALDCRK